MKQIWKIVTALAVTLLFGSVAVSAQDLNQARQLMQSEQYDEAEKVLQTITTSTPANGDAWFTYGELYIKSFLSDSVSLTLKEALVLAGEKYKKGADADTGNPLNFIGLGKVALFKGDEAAANKFFDRAKRAVPPVKNPKKAPNPERYALVLTRLAEAYIYGPVKDTAKALPLLRVAQAVDMAKNPAGVNPEIYLVTGDAYILVYDGTNAIKNFNQANSIDPKSPMAKVKIGTLYVASRNLMAAIPQYEEAIQISPSFAPGFRALGELYSLAGKYDKAKEYFKKYLDISKDNVPAKVRYVGSLFKAKDYAEAIVQAEQILKVDNSRNYINRILGYSYYESKQPDYNKALSYMDIFFKNAPADKVIKKDYMYYGRILIKKNADAVKKATADTARLTKSIKSLETQVAKAPAAQKAKGQALLDSSKTALAAATEIVRIGNEDINKGFDNMKKAVTMDEKIDMAAIGEIATFANQTRRFSVTAEMYEKKIASSATKEPGDLLALGKSYYQAENYKRADEVFQELATMQPENLQAMLWSANCLAAQDPDSKQGIAKPKFAELITKAAADSIKYGAELVEGLKYFGSYYLFTNPDYNKSISYYTRIANINPAKKEWVVLGYTSVGIGYTKAKNYDRSLSFYRKALEADPTNKSVKETIAALEDTIKKLDEYKKAQEAQNK